MIVSEQRRERQGNRKYNGAADKGKEGKTELWEILQPDQVCGGDDKKVVLLLVCQHGYDGQGRIPYGRMVTEALREIVEDGVEIWSAGIKMEMDGINLLSYRNMADYI